MKIILAITIFFYSYSLTAQEKIKIAIIEETINCSSSFTNSIVEISRVVVVQNPRFSLIDPRELINKQPKDEHFLNEPFHSSILAEKAKSVGLQFILFMKVIGCGAEDIIDKNGKLVGYRGWVEVFTSVVDLKTAAIKYSTKFKCYSELFVDRTSFDISKMSIESTEANIKNLLKNAFPFEIGLLKITETNKNGTVNEMLISGGKNLGIEEGDFFDVIIIDTIKSTSDVMLLEKNIGRVWIKQLKGSNKATAKTLTGGREILEAFNLKKNIVLRPTDFKTTDIDIWEEIHDVINSAIATLAIFPKIENLKSDFPSFPYPPPIASAQDILPIGTLKKIKNLDSLDAILTKSLTECGYIDKCYYSVPNGFALVTAVEQFNIEDGSSLLGKERWSSKISFFKDFSLAKYIKALFSANKGHFRFMIFWISSEPMMQSNRNLTADDLLILPKQGADRLPDEIGEKLLTSKYKCTVLIYEFEKSELDKEATFVEKSELLGITHLNKSNIINVIEKYAK